MLIDTRIRPADLAGKLTRFWELSGHKLRLIEQQYDVTKGSPVFTVQGKYTTRGWTEWTQGFQFGSMLLHFDATGQTEWLEQGREATRQRMAPHLTHVGVHDHGFNNISTYGNLRRLASEGRFSAEAWECEFYDLALKCSGAVQARRWTRLHNGGGFIYSFNGPHSLFADTIRSLRALAVAHKLGHVLMEENDRSVSLLDRLIQHARSTAQYSVYYGEGRDAYDIRGRVAHESVFNVTDGRYRCPNSQQGYSPFSTWTRGLAWIMCGFAELLEAASGWGEADNAGQSQSSQQPAEGEGVVGFMLKAARAACDFYIEHTAADGIPYWDTGAPGLAAMGDWRARPSEPFNDYEPVDSSAAAIAAQGLLRLGHYLQSTGSQAEGDRYWQAGLTVVNALLAEPYLSTDAEHQGLILHSVYHRPNGWDYVPPGRKVCCGESSMWGDYHAREVGLYLQRVIRQEPYLRFDAVGT